MSVKILNNYMDERSRASKFVSVLVKICFLPISIEDDVIKIKISKTLVHIIIFPGFCIANLLFARFYFKKWIFSNLVVANTFWESYAVFLYHCTTGKTLNYVMFFLELICKVTLYWK